MFHLLAIAAFLFVVVALIFPSTRTKLLGLFGVAKKDLTDIIGDLEDKITELKNHASELLNEAEEHKAAAAEATANAEKAAVTAKRADAIGDNLKALLVTGGN